MKVKIADTEVTSLLTACTWSGSRTTVARTLDFTIVQDERDKNIPVIKADTGLTVYGYREDKDDLVAMTGMPATSTSSPSSASSSSSSTPSASSGSTEASKQQEQPIFVGNIYKIERDRSKGTLHIVARDHAFILAHSKTTRKFKSIAPEEITKQICAELGVLPGTIAETGTPVSFIANRKTGYQIIMGAYNEAAKIIKQNAGKDKNGKDKEDPKYQLIMNGPKLDVVKKGELIKNFVADAASNMMNSTYSESIESIVNQIMVVDKEGNQKSYVKDDDDIKKHSMFQDVYKEDPNKDTQTEAKAMLKKPERTGTIVMLGDYRVISSYSIEVKDSLQTSVSGKFWVKSDTHTFQDGKHEMKLVLEYENIMNKEETEKEKEQK